MNMPKLKVIPNSLVLDVGSNVGMFAVSFSKLFSNCIIHSFECTPLTVKCLEANIKENKCKNVVVHDFGLSDKNEETAISFIENNLGASSITQSFGRKVEIKTKTLDELNLSNISFIKVDIQDHELHFIKGAEQTLVDNNPIIVFEFPSRTKAEVKLFSRCVKLLKRVGFWHRKQIGSKDWAFSKEKDKL